MEQHTPENFIVKVPSEIIFGNGKVSLLPEKLSVYKELLLVTGKHFSCSEKYGKILQKLQDDGHIVECVTSIRGEGPIEDVDKIIAAGRKISAKAGM